jgi:hypothetical protein
LRHGDLRGLPQRRRDGLVFGPYIRRVLFKISATAGQGHGGGREEDALRHESDIPFETRRKLTLSDCGKPRAAQPYRAKRQPGDERLIYLMREQ